MFGGSVLPTLPPIIKAGNGPIRIVPNYGESQASNSNQAAGAASSENLVSREEQPVNIEPPKPAPRVVSAIPINSGQNITPPGAAPTPSGAFATAPNAAPAASPWPPAPPMAATLPAPAPAGGSGQVPTEPKRIHTVTIRPDQGAPVEAANPAVPPPAARTVARPALAAPKPAAAASPPPAGRNAPLSIVPGGQAETAAPAPVRAHAAAAPVVAPMSVASAGPVTGVAPAPATVSGGYAVQVTSQRSEAEAQASFRELRAKFPNQLNGREPIIRRADLGAKGTYYRALVGPFASMDEASGLCSGLKAAGGNCIVQKN
jgi:hypothetical protein